MEEPPQRGLEGLHLSEEDLWDEVSSSNKTTVRSCPYCCGMVLKGEEDMKSMWL